MTVAHGALYAFYSIYLVEMDTRPRPWACCGRWASVAENRRVRRAACAVPAFIRCARSCLRASRRRAVRFVAIGWGVESLADCSPRAD
jgi:hypothetical protein